MKNNFILFSLMLVLSLLFVTRANACCSVTNATWGEDLIVITNDGQSHKLNHDRKLKIDKNQFPVTIKYDPNYKCGNSLKIDKPGCHTISGTTNSPGSCMPLKHVNWCP